MGDGAIKGRAHERGWRVRFGLSIAVALLSIVLLTTCLGWVSGALYASYVALLAAGSLWAALARVDSVIKKLGATTALDGGCPIVALEVSAKKLANDSSERDRLRHRISGLPTREPLLERMAKDRAGALGLVAFIDFDRLCSFDPAYADWAIEQLARRMAKLVGRERMIAHVDRSAFVLWFDDRESMEDARSQLDAIGYALGNALEGEGRILTPSIRLYLAPYSFDTEAPYRALEKLLSTSLLQGIPVLPDSTHAAAAAPEIRRAYELEQELRNAILRGELHLQFQPQIDAASCSVSGAEALLRWNSPTRGTVSPQVIVPLLESSGLIEEVGLWILNAACREVRSWRTLGYPLSVAVNVSSHQLANRDLHARLLRILATHGLPTSALEIELTETAASQDPERSAKFFQSLREYGVCSAIDDFGTGFSSLSALRKLRFDKIKIDREFVTAVDSRRDSQAICQSIIALARGLGIRVIAEGVERHEEYIWLRRHGCAEFQGYYFSLPLDSVAFHGFIADGEGLRSRLAHDPAHMRQNLIERLNP